MKKFELKNIRASESPKWSDSHVCVDVYYNDEFVMTYNYNVFVAANNNKLDVKLKSILRAQTFFRDNEARIQNAFDCIKNVFMIGKNRYSKRLGRATLLNMYNDKIEIIAPTDKELMECITIDYQAFKDSIDFNDFCDNFGYSNDSIEALDVYNSLKDSFIRFSKVFDNDELNEILNTEY